MKERPILFNGDMVRAILDGRKTQTRRMVKHIPDLGAPDSWCHKANDNGFAEIVGDYTRYCPFGNVGDRLWVREAFAKPDHGEDNIAYRASEYEDTFRWMPSIHMPRWASRITLEITGVRVERLSSIRESDAKSEGFDGSTIVPGHDGLECRAWFEGLWDSVYGDNSFRSNPWVWVVEFKVVKS